MTLDEWKGRERLGSREPKRLEERLGWTFRDRALLVEALTHSTFVNENADAGACNERLEFLGDAVLGLLVAAILFEELPEASEGELSRRRARVVRRSGFAQRARELDIWSELRLGQGERNCSQSSKETLLADAYEALAGAVFLDGGYEAVERCFGAPLEKALASARDTVDFKTLLQETCHRLTLPPPHYEVVDVSGPDHARQYTCSVSIEGAKRGQGTASSKKQAQQECARQALEALAAANQGGDDSPGGAAS